jgi:hypothetical protein
LISNPKVILMAQRRSPQKRRAKSGQRGGKAATAPLQPGLPDPAHVVAERSFTSPHGRRYRILTTTESDEYDQPGES